MKTKTKTKTRNALCGLLSGLLLLAAGNTTVRAGLTDLGGGMIYDDVLDITWLQNANQGGSRGRDAARAWAENLVYGGYDDWRLPNMDVNGDGAVLLGRYTGGDTDNEFSWMFFHNLGGSFFQNKTGTQTSIDGITFTGITARYYTADTGNPSSNPYVYVMSDGGQFVQSGGTAAYGTWAVRDGGAPLNTPPVADAGTDFSVNEGQTGVTLDGSLSSDPDNDPLAYAWEQIGGTTVVLTGADTVNPTFTAPMVAFGGETLSFDLTVTANDETSTDTVNVMIVNVNHAPVADAGPDQMLASGTAVAEGSPVSLQGGDSFDIDNDVIDFAWTQIGGPAVALVGADTANPTFDAPYFEAGGAAGVVATLTFELFVDDGFPADVPAEGFTLANVRDTVTIEITNTNNPPVASAGPDQTVDEGTSVTLDGSLSSDPDSDALAYSWTQVGGPPVVLADAATATPSFTAPWVNAGGASLEFELTVDDGYGGSDAVNAVVHVQDINDPPDASLAQPTIALLWPPNHALVAVGVTGVSDPDNNATIVITGVFQDEPTHGLGDGDTPIDAIISGDTVLLRAERSGKGNGRVYHIHFTASDFEGSSSGVVKVAVPHNMKKVAVDDGALFNSTE